MAIYATSCELYGWPSGSEILIDLEIPEVAPLVFSPSGTDPYSTPTVSAGDSDILDPYIEYSEGQYVVTMNGVNAGNTTLTISLPTESGTPYTITYNVSVSQPTVYATTFDVNGWTDGGSYTYTLTDSVEMDYIYDQGEPFNWPSVTSSNPLVATITYQNDCGFGFSCEQEGSATITVTYVGESDTVTKTYTVVVDGGGTTYAEDFDIDGVQSGGTISLTAGEGNVTYNYVYTPSGSTPWQTPQCTVADTGIANVNLSSDNDFAIQGFTAGTTTLTISYEPESGNIITKTYTVDVAPPVAENFSLDGYSYGDTISLQDTATSIAVEFSPAGSVPSSFTATSSDTAVATVAYANGAITITPVADGTATLTAVLNGTDSETYTISVAFPPEPVPTNKVLGYEAVGFFKAKIEEASGGGGFTQLTEADYNATDASGQPCLYIGDLEPGVYFIGSESGWIYGISVNSYSRDRINGTFIVNEWVSNSSTDYQQKTVYWMSVQGQLSQWTYYNSNSQGWEFESNSYFADQNSVSSQIDQYMGQLYAQPTSNTYGNTGALYKFVTENTDPDTGQWIGNTAEWWLCKGQEFDPSTGSTYEWVQLPTMDDIGDIEAALQVINNGGNA